MCGFNHLIFILSERSSISCNIWRVVHSQPLDWHKGNGCVLTDSWSLGRGDRGVIIMPNKCHDTVIRWRVETRRLVRPGKLGCSLLSHYSVPSVSQGCQSELPHTPHTLVSSSPPLWSLCILLSVPGHPCSLFLMLKAGQRVYKIYESK